MFEGDLDELDRELERYRQMLNACNVAPEVQSLKEFFAPVVMNRTNPDLASDSSSDRMRVSTLDLIALTHFEPVVRDYKKYCALQAIWVVSASAQASASTPEVSLAPVVPEAQILRDESAI